MSWFWLPALCHLIFASHGRRMQRITEAHDRGHSGHGQNFSSNALTNLLTARSLPDTVAAWQVRPFAFGRGAAVRQLSRSTSYHMAETMLRRRDKDLRIGLEVNGKVVEILPDSAGVNVDIGTKVWYFLHQSEIEDAELAELKVDDPIKCWIKSIGGKKQNLLTAYKPGTRVPRAELETGQERSGIIKKVMQYGAFVDIGAEVQALLHVSDLEGGRDALDGLSAGDMIECWIKSIEKEKEKPLLTTYKPGTRVPLAMLKAWQETSGVVMDVTKYGVLIDIGAEYQALVHVSEMGEATLNELSAGDTIAGWIKSVDRKKKQVLVTTYEPGSRVPLAELKAGQEYSGVVKKRIESGVFVDIGAEIQAFVHVSLLEGGQAALEELSAGDTIVGWIKSFDSEKGKLLLTTYTYKPEALAELKIGQEQSGVVVKKTPYGAFVDIGAAGQFLLHVSSIAGGIDALNELSEGDAITCWIKSIDAENGTLLLADYEPGTRVPLADIRRGQPSSGVIKKVTEYGVHIDIGAEVQALVHVSAMEGGEATLNELSAGDTITGWIKSVDLDNQRVRVQTYPPAGGMPRPTTSERMQTKDLKIQKWYKGVVTKVMDYGVMVDIGAFKDLLLRVSDLLGGHAALEKLSKGDSISCHVKAIHGNENQMQRTEVVLLSTRAWGDRKRQWAQPLEEIKVGQRHTAFVRKVVGSTRQQGTPVAAIVTIGAKKLFRLHVSEIEGGEAALWKLREACDAAASLYSARPGALTPAAKTRLERKKNGLGPFPCWIKSVGEENFNRTVTFYDPKTRLKLVELKPGLRKYNGTITHIVEKHGAHVDIGAESRGFLHLPNIKGAAPTGTRTRWRSPLEDLSVGDSIACWIKSVDTKKQDLQLTTHEPFIRLRLAEFQAGQEVSGSVMRVQKYGAFVDIGAEEQALLHVSNIDGGARTLAHISRQYARKPKIACWIKSVDLENDQISLTTYNPAEKVPLMELKEGQEYSGHVMKVMEYGLFVDIGAQQEAFMSVYDLEGGHAALKQLSAGDVITCWIHSTATQVLDNAGDKRVRLTTYKPGTRVPLAELEKGQELSGVVEKVLKSGPAFVDVGAEGPAVLQGVDFEGGQAALEELSEGDSITCWVKSIDWQRKKIRTTAHNPGTRASLTELNVDQEYSGVVKQVTEYGAFVDIGAEEQGLMPISEFEGGEAALKDLSAGDMIACWIKSIDLEKEQFVATTYKPGARVPLAELKIGQEQSGVVVKKTLHGAIVNIGAESQSFLNWRAIMGGRPALEKLSEGDKIACWITAIDLEKNEISVSQLQKELENIGAV